MGHVIILGVKGRRVGTCNNLWSGGEGRGGEGRGGEGRGGELGQVIILGVKGRKVGTCNNPWSGNNPWSEGKEGWDR